jgi:hypothetical protein
MEDFIEDLEELVCRVSDAAEGSMTALVTISKEKQDLASINGAAEKMDGGIIFLPCQHRALPCHGNMVLYDGDTVPCQGITVPCPCTPASSLRGFSPEFPSHIRIVLSQEPDMMRVPRAEKQTEMTVFVFSFMTSLAVLASHIRIVLSAELDTMWLPSGEKLTDVPVLVCSLRGFVTSSLILASHIRIILLSKPDAMIPVGSEVNREVVAIMSMQFQSGRGIFGHEDLSCF